MSSVKPFLQVQITVGATTFDNCVEPSNAAFLKVKKAVIKRSTSTAVTTSTVQIFNKGGTYNSIVKNSLVEIWVGDASDGSDKVKYFSGTITRRQNSKSKIRGCVLEILAKDKTIGLLNGAVFDTFSANDVKRGGDGVNYTLTDYAEIIKYLMSFRGSRQANPGAITTTNVQNSGQNISEKKVYYYYPTLKVIQSYAQICGYDAYVDVSNDLHFQPKNSSINATALSSATNVEAAEEIEDSEEEKNKIYVNAGKTTDGQPVIGIYVAPIATGDTIKPAWKYNQSIAPNADGSTAAERYSNAINMAREWARLEYEKVKNKHTYRFTINQRISATIGDIFLCTDPDLGLSSTSLRLTELEENFTPTDSYKAVFLLDTDFS
jgi:hypothetical protein